MLIAHKNPTNYRVRSSSAWMISLILHVLFALIMLLYIPKSYYQALESLIPVKWVEVPEPAIRREQPKPNLELKFDPKREIGKEGGSNVFSRASSSNIAEVIEKSKRVVRQSVELNQYDPSKILPEMMTAARVREPTSSELKQMVSMRGPTDGQGEKTGRVRPKGKGLGGTGLLDAYGGRGQGSGRGPGAGGGGGGGSGLPDRFGMINFLDERQGPQKVVYCLDVSASMGAAGLKKIDLAVAALKDSLLMLNDQDEFNIITFADRVEMMRSAMIPGEMSNIQKAIQYLSRFNRESIAENLGTSILPAIESALKLQPNIVVLITDAQITPGQAGGDLSQEPKAILETIRIKNPTHAVFYSIGLEANSLAVKLLEAITQQTSGKMKIVKSDELQDMAESDSIPRL